MTHLTPPQAAASDSTHSLRKTLRQQRTELSPATLSQHADQFARHLRNHPWFNHARRIACYLPVNGEMDPTRIMDLAWQRKKAVFLPVLQNYSQHMIFAPYGPETRLKNNRFGIPEPDVPRNKMRAPKELDLVILPLVAFDGTGNRMGMGGGYYDRSFSFLRFALEPRRPRLVGAAHELQRVAQLEAQDWDVPLDAVVTETGVQRFR